MAAELKPGYKDTKIYIMKESGYSGVHPYSKLKTDSSFHFMQMCMCKGDIDIAYIMSIIPKDKTRTKKGKKISREHTVCVT